MKAIYIVLFVFVSSVACGQRPMSGGPMSEAQAAIDVTYYELDLKLDPEEKTLNGRVDVVFKQLRAAKEWELDLMQQYSVSEIKSGDQILSFSHKDGKIFIPFNAALVKDGMVSLSIFYGGKTPIAPNAPWEGGFSYAKSPNGNHWVGLSSQNDGADIFMPCKDQPSDKPDSVRMHIHVPAGYQAIGNGLLENSNTESDWHTYTWATHYPINNYSINFTLGKFSFLRSTYTSVDGNEVKVDVYLLEENKDKLEILSNMAIDNLQHHEQYFGEYPFANEKFGLVETPYLGMEHQTINAYGNQYRFTEIDGKQFDWLLLHELGHEWWANKVTASDWADFWIHEGICAFSDALYHYTNFGWDGYWKKMSQTRNTITNQKPVVMGRNIPSVTAYHSDIYNKGAFVMHMLWDILGDDQFFGILYDLANSPESTYQNGITTAYFVQLVNDKTGEDFGPFFKFFMEGTELPKVVIRKGEDGEYQVSIPNIDFYLPMEIHTSEGIERYELSKNPISILSVDKPKVDPEGYYLRVIEEK
jgi:aminopeptidase N